MSSEKKTEKLCSICCFFMSVCDWCSRYHNYVITVDSVRITRSNGTVDSNLMEKLCALLIKLVLYIKRIKNPCCSLSLFICDDNFTSWGLCQKHQWFIEFHTMYNSTSFIVPFVNVKFLYYVQTSDYDVFFLPCQKMALRQSSIETNPIHPAAAKSQSGISFL